MSGGVARERKGVVSRPAAAAARSPCSNPWLNMSNMGATTNSSPRAPAGTCAARLHTIAIAHVHRLARKCSSGKSSGNASVSAGKSASLCAPHRRKTASLNPTTFDPSRCARSLPRHISGVPMSLGRIRRYGYHGESSART